MVDRPWRVLVPGTIMAEGLTEEAARERVERLNASRPADAFGRPAWMEQHAAAPSVGETRDGELDHDAALRELVAAMPGLSGASEAERTAYDAARDDATSALPRVLATAASPPPIQEGGRGYDFGVELEPAPGWDTGLFGGVEGPWRVAALYENGNVGLAHPQRGALVRVPRSELESQWRIVTPAPTSQPPVPAGGEGRELREWTIHVCPNCGRIEPTLCSVCIDPERLGDGATTPRWFRTVPVRVRELPAGETGDAGLREQLEALLRWSEQQRESCRPSHLADAPAKVVNEKRGPCASYGAVVHKLYADKLRDLLAAGESAEPGPAEDDGDRGLLGRKLEEHVDPRGARPPSPGEPRAVPPGAWHADKAARRALVDRQHLPAEPGEGARS